MSSINILRRNEGAKSSLRWLGVISGSLLLPASLFASGMAQALSPLPQGYLERAHRMLGSGIYDGVIDQLRHLQTQNTDFSILEIVEPNARQAYVYMLAEALYEKGDENCVAMLRDFARTYPSSPEALQALLSIGDYYFFNHDWETALEEYQEIDMDRLNASDNLLYSYRQALCRLKLGEGGQTRSVFQRLSKYPEYKDAATFYLAYLDYEAGELDAAYKGFSKVDAGQEGLAAPFYMLQIDYARGKYEQTARDGKSLLRGKVPEELEGETLRAVGMAEFKLGDYAQAKGYLDKYLAAVNGDATPEAIYALGVIDYEDGQYEKAASRFGVIAGEESAIGQSALLYAGQCDLKTGNADSAAMAFEKAAQMDYDPKVTERALYDYAAAVTRGGKIPFSTSAPLLERFIAIFPNSEHAPVVDEYLAVAYYNDHAYTKALERINSIKRPSAKVYGIKQKILYQLGVERVSNGAPAEGAQYLRQAIALAKYDRSIAAESALWLGDALYSAGDYKGAATQYASAIKELPASANRSLALYGAAYCAYMQSDWSKAVSEFAKAINAQPALPVPLKGDAVTRRADCLYYIGDHASARKGYAEAISMGAPDSDYATYRHAVMTGLAQNTSGKLAELSALEQRFPDSRWLADAMLEKAMTLQGLGRSADADKSFREVALKFPNAPQARQALLNVALEKMKKGDGVQAAEAYREVIERWPSSEEAAIAVDDLKKYYASTGDLASFADFLRSVPGAPSINADEMERLAFDGAETAYAENINEIALLRKYVADYPDGAHLAQALYDIAMSLQSQKKYGEAEEILSQLLARRPHSTQAPEALMMKAEILEKNLPGRTADALVAYRELEKTGGADFAADAVSGVMRLTNDPAERLEYSRKVRNAGGLSAESLEEAALYEAEALAALGRKEEATAAYEALAQNPSTLSGARAAVALAEYHLKNKNWEAARVAAERFTDEGTPHQYWLAKGYIALADALHGQGNNRLATEYLRSLRTNYPGKEKDIADAINNRLKSWK